MINPQKHTHSHKTSYIINFKCFKDSLELTPLCTELFIKVLTSVFHLMDFGTFAEKSTTIQKNWNI